jgi:hypothetical protein
MEIDINTIASRHGFSNEAVAVALQALQAGGGNLAQFAHPEFDGMGQWMPGMTMIGDMFNQSLKSRVTELFEELAQELGRGNVPPSAAEANAASGGSKQHWWPDDFGTPSAVGGQNDVRYAYFPKIARLILDRDGDVIVYDTAGHTITGVSQQQSGPGGTVAFTSQQGVVPVSSLRVVSGPH